VNKVASKAQSNLSTQKKELGKTINATSFFVSLAEGIKNKLKKLNITTLFDFIIHLPLRYEDETQIRSIKSVGIGNACVIEGIIVDTKIVYKPKRNLICLVEDETGSLCLRFLHFYPNQLKGLAAGNRVRVFGEPRLGFSGLEMVHPKYRVVHEDTPLPKSLTPVYPTTAGLTQDKLTKLIHQALHDFDFEDTLPNEILNSLSLWKFADSIQFLHNPPPGTAIESIENREHPAWRRLKFDELLAQQLSMRLHYQQRHSQKSPCFREGKLLPSLLSALPFALTAAQKKTLSEILNDLNQSYPMHRLLQGDVGSGKTIVAALAALRAIENNYQVAFMAPTEILAEQHFKKLSSWLAPLNISVTWLSSSVKQKSSVLTEIAAGRVQLIIGTHALIQEQVNFNNLGLIIIDEQHRFGVEQRLALRLKGQQPHQLMMSATPIPRTLSMSYYADLDVSVIDELPPGRIPVTTKLVADKRRDEVIMRLREACLSGTQAYWVCPLIEESEVLQLQTAVDTYSNLSQTFPELKIGLLHGRMTGAEKNKIMEDFKNHALHLLVATTVIEVGVDVPNATLMVIEHAERMGLAQLHQLRGRVGRGAAQSSCILLYQTPLSETARTRLKIIFESNNGFEIAQQDLTMRGPGEFLGARQSGVPMLRFADLAKDEELLLSARELAEHLLATQTSVADKHLKRWLPDKTNYLRS
jgi:ATP-dependent DNA helicase RecG